MERKANLFILTTEYHLLLSMSIMDAMPDASKNILVFTGERLSQVKVEKLPASVEVIAINKDGDKHLREKMDSLKKINRLANIFVFTAYRDLETYMLTTVASSVTRNLVQDGANFYFKVRRPFMISRLTETWKIYSNLWRRGILLKKLVLFKPHMAQCSFIDRVWVTNPEVYQQPQNYQRPVNKVTLTKQHVNAWRHCFTDDDMALIDDTLIYISSRFTQENMILQEINQVRAVRSNVNKSALLIKLHPNSSALQTQLFTQAFGSRVLKNSIPVELYLAMATNSVVVGGVTAALYFNNSTCSYFSLLKIYQCLTLFPKWIDVNFPSHVRVIEKVEDLQAARVDHDGLTL